MSKEPNNTQKPAKNSKPDKIAGYNENIALQSSMLTSEGLEVTF
jgi:hypothetical protein